jgi:hypothetical protein
MVAPIFLQGCFASIHSRAGILAKAFHALAVPLKSAEII